MDTTSEPGTAYPSGAPAFTEVAFVEPIIKFYICILDIFLKIIDNYSKPNQ